MYLPINLRAPVISYRLLTIANMSDVNNILIFVEILALFAISCAEIGDNCYTPKGESGQCKTIRKCPVLFSIIRTNPIKPEDAELLRKSKCGSETSTPIPNVCCPVADSDESDEDSSSEEITAASSDVLPLNCGIDTADRIFGGKEASLNEFPWMVLLGYINGYGEHSFLCGGSLISERYVLTAAHCVKVTGRKLVNVRLGEHNRDTESDCDDEGNYCAPKPQDIPISKKIIHKDYNLDGTTYHHDIALLRLQRRVIFSESIKPICLPLSVQAQKWNLTGISLKVAGWGETPNALKSAVKLYVNVPVKPHGDCVDKYKEMGISLLENSQMCVGGEKKKDSCTGDSGGPLMHRAKNHNRNLVYYVVGVVSVGPADCGIENFPGIYTRVASYVHWIVDKLEP